MARRLPTDFSRKVHFIYALLIAGNVAAWAWAMVMFGGNAALMGTAMLAYTLGLRHAVDADHIAAIDNVTRKLVAQGQKPTGVGLFFSLGHSTVVVLACAGIALLSATLTARFAPLRELGALLGASVSGQLRTSRAEPFTSIGPAGVASRARKPVKLTTRSSLT
jgi:high-affinity nickel-transport protein